MCLVVKAGCKIEITEKPILVSRKYRKYGLFRKRWGPLVWETKKRWKYNESVEACEHLKIFNFDSIGSGFHSNLALTLISANAIIPKGAEYCYGLFNEVVSNKLIVFSSNRKLRKYLKEQG